MTKFNGHKNWNHWNVALWIANDEGLYRAAKDLLRRHTKDEAARLMLESLPIRTPDGANYSYSSVRAALKDL